MKDLWVFFSRRGFAVLSTPATRRFVFGSVLAWLLGHLLIWIVVAQVDHRSWVAMLDHWDSGWYSKIVVRGYFWPAWAFYPLYPLIVKGLSTVFLLGGYPQVVGSVLSTALFVVFCHVVVRLDVRDQKLRMLIPTTRAGWLFFLLSPASFVFHSHHTESLFLLLTLLAFVFALRPERGRWALAAVIAGLAALTRPQGIFLAVVTALGSSVTPAKLPWPRRAARFAASGLMSGALFACYPLYQWCVAGDAWISQSSQLHWRPEMTAGSFVRALWFGNTWQQTDVGSLERHAGFFLLVAMTVALARERRRLIAVFVGLCVAVMPASGEFVGVFRYGSVLFPLLFLAGDKVGRLPRALIIVIGCYWLHLNVSLTWRYVILRWCY